MGGKMVSKKTPCLEGKVEKWYEEGKKLREVEEAKIPFTPPRKSSFMANFIGLHRIYYQFLDFPPLGTTAGQKTGGGIWLKKSR